MRLEPLRILAPLAALAALAAAAPDRPRRLRLAAVVHASVGADSRPSLAMQGVPAGASPGTLSALRVAAARRAVPRWSLLSRCHRLRQLEHARDNLDPHDPNHPPAPPVQLQAPRRPNKTLPASPLRKVMLVPDHTDPATVLSVARLTFDSYYEPDDAAWVPVPGWNVSGSFGWLNGGIRGYLFVDDLEQILIIVIKGTSLATPIGSGPTSRLDKLNDNMMFSCCCAKAGWEWKAICDCPKSGNQCSISCLLKESNFDGSYYNLAQTIYLAVQEWFPKHTNIWMAGHSLGGALAALVALTNDLPSFSFESPGDLLYASRIGLLPDMVDPTTFLDSLSIYHFGNDGDPIFLGLCTGLGSSCYWLDYALETKCHVGHECTYASSPTQSDPQPQTQSDNTDTVNATRSIQYHSIEFVIRKFLEGATSVPECVTRPLCLNTECPSWTFTD